MEYYFNNLSPTSFQRLLNSVLVSRLGEDARLTPLRGADGGRDGETAAGNPFFEYQVNAVPQTPALSVPPRAGRYLFQVKHHRTIDTRASDARKVVIADFEKELKKNVLSRVGSERVNYFFLVTNVPSSKDSIEGVDKARTKLLKGELALHADVWWQEQVVAFLDQLPALWNSFPEMFAGGRVPFLGEVISRTNGLPRAVRIALDNQYTKDRLVRFKQIELEKSLAKLFVDLDVDTKYLSSEDSQPLFVGTPTSKNILIEQAVPADVTLRHRRSNLLSAIGVLMNEDSNAASRILLEGGPGQGKSTITQMMAQIYRNEVLGKNDLEPEGRWVKPKKVRLPFRIELRNYAEWLGNKPEGSVEEYISNLLKRDSGGSEVKVEDIHTMVENSPVLLIFDGLDEVGSDELRDTALDRITECVERFITNLQSDVKVIVTTRPPAIAGRREHLVNFSRFPITPMETERVKSYVDRWLSVQLQDDDDRGTVKESFERRRNEPHVDALAKNPMQLSVLLHFIRLKGEAFPDRRAELYREYFRTVIDRDVEKSPALRQQRDIIEVLHQLLGYKIHSLTEAKKADGTLTRSHLLRLVQEWLNCQGHRAKTAHEIFKLGEERLGLIVALRGEGEETRYGYEIQPIREYFAAAFINEQIQGDAHEVYQALLRRQYWKEVALFLAGLRRPNEKADLVTRAKETDNDESLGWRQDGRNITLQLLQEGVFSQPHHVYADALDFLIDLLDPSVIKAFNEPKDYLDTLIAVLKHGDSKRHLERITNILNNNKSTLDAHLLYRIYKVLSQLLDGSKIRRELLGYKEGTSSIKARVRIAWPYSWGIDMKPVAKSPSFWQDISDKDVSVTWWDTAMSYDLATNLPAKDAFHMRLFELYAMNPFPIYELAHPFSMEVMNPRVNWAIWRLVKYQQLLKHAPLDEVVNKADLKDLRAKSYDLDCSGLNKAIAKEVTELIGDLRALLSATFLERGDISLALSNYISTIRKYAGKPGLLGLIACRSGMSLIRLDVSVRLALHRAYVPMKPNRRVIEAFLGNDWHALRVELKPFFKTGDFGADLNLYVERYSHGATNFVPTDIKINAKRGFVPVTSLLADSICKGKKIPFKWIERILLPPSIIRPLIDKCEQHFHRLLPALNDLNFKLIGDFSGKPLRIQTMRRILKLVRTSNDPRVASGALLALSSSNFLKLAGKDLILKMIKATADDVYANLFFEKRRPYMNSTTTRDVKLCINIAEDIMRSPKEYGLKYVIAAASFLAEHQSINLPPLLQEESTLGLNIQQPTTKDLG
jgi:NACHT domain